MRRCVCLVFIVLYGLVGSTAAFARAGSSNLEEEVQDLKARISDLEAEMKAAKLADDGTFRAYWKDGLRLDSANGDFKLKIGGRIQNDWLWWVDDSDEIEGLVGELEDSVEFRRARLYMSGELYKYVEFKAQYDFAGGDADFKDVYIGLKSLPTVGGIRVGHFKEPFSLEELTSSKYITFLERALPNVFAPSRNVGVMLHNHVFEDRMTWAVGVFRDTDDFGEDAGGECNLTGRITGLPWYEDDGERLAHLGVSYSHRNPDDDTLRYRQRPEIHNTERFVDTGSLSSDDVDVVDLEAATVFGPLSIQGEYTQTMVSVIGDDDADLGGWYVQASYFLTGEHRAYKTSSATFDRTKPHRNFLDGEGGMGAWEVAARCSSIDLFDGSVDGGEEDNVTVALNWYMNPNTRIMLNYQYLDLDRDTVSDDASAVQARFQIDF